MVGRGGVADDQRGPSGVVAQRVVAESLDGHAPGGRAGDDPVFGLAAGQLNDRVQARRDPGEADIRGTLGERGDEPVAAPPAVEPRAPDVPVVGP